MELPGAETITTNNQARTASANASRFGDGSWLGNLRRWAFSNNAQQHIIPGFLRLCLRIILIMAAEYRRAHISLRASALTYAIILSMVPLLAMSTAVLKGLGSDNQLKIAAYRLINQLEPEENNGASAETPSKGQHDNRSLTGHLRHGVDTIFAYVDRTNFAALGAFGIMGLIVVVIVVLSSVEDAMNAIWHSRKGRSLFRKVMDYLALLILLPISINVALAGDAILHSPHLMEVVGRVIPVSWLIRMVLKLLPLLFIVMTLMVMYLFFTTARVKTMAAFWGALFAAVSWLLVQRAYIILQIGVAKYNAIYGSFATIPLFLIWLHLGWTFILLGATMAYAIQNRHNTAFYQSHASPREQLRIAFDLLITVNRNFRKRRITSMDQLRQLAADQETLDRLIEDLVRNHLVARVCEADSEGLVPAVPLEEINPSEVAALIFGPAREAASPGALVAEAVVSAAESGCDRHLWQQLITSRNNHDHIP